MEKNMPLNPTKFWFYFVPFLQYDKNKMQREKKKAEKKKKKPKIF